MTFFDFLQFLKTDYGVVCEVLEPVISAKAKVLTFIHAVDNYSYLPAYVVDVTILKKYILN